MKKNIILIIVVICAILIILLGANLIRNYTIISKICEAEEDVKNSLNNYYYEETTRYNTEEETTKSEIYVLDGIYDWNFYIDENLEGTLYINSNTGEVIKSEETLNEEFEIEELYQNMLLTSDVSKDDLIKLILLENIYKPLKKEENQYVINLDDFVVYVDAETNLVTKWTSENVTKTFAYEKDVVTAEDVEEPNV